MNKLAYCLVLWVTALAGLAGCGGGGGGSPGGDNAQSVDRAVPVVINSVPPQ